MAASCDLNVAKKNLQESLGESMKIYFQNLKSWFKQKITKEDFDLEARKLLNPDSVHLHNEFLLAIISRCQSLSSSLVPGDSSLIGKSDQVRTSKSIKHLKKKRSNCQKFVAVNPVMYATEASFKGSEDLLFASRELMLPDITMVHGRMLVCAWESGLDEVSDMAIKLVMQAVENQLKNLISMVLSRRSGYKVREKKFRFAVGCQVKNPYFRHSNLMDDTNAESEATMVSQTGNHIPSHKPPLEIGEVAAAEQLSSAADPCPKAPVSLYDFLETLKLNRSVIPSHSVYAPAVERVLHRLWHPSNEDFMQEIIHRQEVSIKQQMASQGVSNQPITGHVTSSHTPQQQQPFSGHVAMTHGSGHSNSATAKQGQGHISQQQLLNIKTEHNAIKVENCAVKSEEIFIKSEPVTIKTEYPGFKLEHPSIKTEHHPSGHSHHHSSGTHHKSEHHSGSSHHHMKSSDHHKSSPSHHHHHHHKSSHHSSSSGHHSSHGHHSSGHRSSSSSGHHVLSENQIPTLAFSSNFISGHNQLPQQQHMDFASPEISDDHFSMDTT